MFVFCCLPLCLWADNKDALKSAIGFQWQTSSERSVERITLIHPKVTPELWYAFNALDRNVDQYLSQEEVAKGDETLFRAFHQADGDEDNVLSVEEFAYIKTVELQRNVLKQQDLTVSN